MGTGFIWFRKGLDDDFYDDDNEPSVPSAAGSSGLHIKWALRTDNREEIWIALFYCLSNKYTMYINNYMFLITLLHVF